MLDKFISWIAEAPVMVVLCLMLLMSRFLILFRPNMVFKMVLTPFRFRTGKRFYTLITHAFADRYWIMLFNHVLFLLTVGRALEIEITSKLAGGASATVQSTDTLVYGFILLIVIALSALPGILIHKNNKLYIANGSNALFGFVFCCWAGLHAFDAMPVSEIPVYWALILYLLGTGYFSYKFPMARINISLYFFGGVSGAVIAILLNR